MENAGRVVFLEERRMLRGVVAAQRGEKKSCGSRRAGRPGQRLKWQACEDRRDGLEGRLGFDVNGGDSLFLPTLEYPSKKGEGVVLRRQRGECTVY